MTRYIALLRGINISGKNKISMPDLKTALIEKGFADVKTYLNSGNVLFSDDEMDVVKLAERIRIIISETFQLQEYLKDHLNRDCFVFAVEEDGKIISIAFLLIQEKPANPRFPHGRVGNIMNVYTVAEKRRQGIAGNVIKQIMDFGKTQNLDFLELKAAPMGYPLYKKLGFEDACSRCKEMEYHWE
ncbi:Acetyltransferase (GNAT) family protein [Treponema bryantii]|uniref:Acetyltransferase (GNAT) family protein n=1 Tax=Treponema bryantii TaxID=163 RepID=A0A1H9DAZ8_9SPIR|nr:GNAT family N-acetyltransferase [Treponema bryantii]SEQ09918.1 Acetyltransferase (GNAT) family protein [Treponema bryantii]